MAVREREVVVSKKNEKAGCGDCVPNPMTRIGKRGNKQYNKNAKTWNRTSTSKIRAIFIDAFKKAGASTVKK